MSNRPAGATTPDALFVHDMKNQLGIILGFCELLMDTTPPSDPRHVDVLEIQKAALAAAALLAQITPTSP